MQVEFRSHFLGEKKCVLWAGKYGNYILILLAYQFITQQNIPAVILGSH